jgi:hypothetical protein
MKDTEIDPGILASLTLVLLHGTENQLNLAVHEYHEIPRIMVLSAIRRKAIVHSGPIIICIEILKLQMLYSDIRADTNYAIIIGMVGGAQKKLEADTRVSKLRKKSEAFIEGFILRPVLAEI